MATADFSRIATNIGALNALQSLNNINTKLGIHQQRLATGKRINSAADDPAGLTIATKLNARSQGLKVAGDNIADAKNLLSVAESGLSKVNDLLTTMRNKAEQAASDTLGTSERAAIIKQMTAYAAQINDAIDQTKWNGNKLLDGLTDFGGELTFQTGADKGDTTVLDDLQDVRTSELDLTSVATGHAFATANIVKADGTSYAGFNASINETATATELSGGYHVRVEFGADSAATSTISLYHDGIKVGSATDKFSDADAQVTFSVGDYVATVNLASTAFAANTDANVGEFYVVKAGDTVLGSSSAASKALLSTSNASDFSAYMDDLQTALDTVSNELSKVGALMGRLTFKEEQVAISQVNVEASYNRIMNADMAFEQLEATKYSILQQTSTTMLAQANTAPQGILGLFR